MANPKKKKLETQTFKIRKSARQTLPALAEKYSQKLGVTVNMIDAASMAIEQMNKQLSGELK